ncbi:MAG: M20/M25/M40 family metallo-hydrolase [Bryobacterales bacterium]|nr:M20/M25/M40 family metallo-hydrolase [Bryobacterales bacterium]
MRRLLLIASLFARLLAAQTQPDWSKFDPESLGHFQALLRIDTSSPPGNEIRAVEYLRKALEREGLPVRTFALDPQRPNLVARIKGNGKKRPLLIMGHTDVVSVDPKKWTFPPFSATVDKGYVYARGTLDDKDNLTACLMVTLLLKRLNVPLDRDVIFMAESGEEGGMKFGIDYMVNNHYSEIDAEIALAEGGGGIVRRGGNTRYATIGTAEKARNDVRLIARGPAGHGSVPLRTNPVVHIAQAVAKVGAWQTPMRLNDTTRAYFERLATISTPEQAARYNGIFDPVKAPAIQEYFAVNEPRHYSLLRTSISPNVINAGYRYNVIPSEAEAILDVRAAPGEDMPALLDELRRVINDPAVEVVNKGATRPYGKPSPVDSEPYRALERMLRKHYNVPVLPFMMTGASDSAQLRARGVLAYGIDPLVDEEDGPLGFGAHSDQERILVAELQRFVRFHYDAVVEIAAAK